MQGRFSGHTSSHLSPHVPIVGGFDPRNISGLVLWFKADANVFSNFGGSTPCVNNDPVQVWGDNSVSAKNLVQATSANRPTFLTNIQNGLPVVKGSTDDFMATAAMTLNQPEHVFFVVRPDDTTTQSRLADGVSGVNAMTIYHANATAQLDLYAGSVGPETVGLVAGTFAVVDGVFNHTAGTSFMRVNNGAKSATADPGTGNAGGLTLFAAQDGTLNGNLTVGEILIFNAELSNNDASAVNHYLGGKWGITVS